MLVACAIAAAAVSMAMKGINGVVLGALGGASVVPIVLAIKLVRWPSAPVLGDGDVVVVLLVAYFVAAIIGAVAGRRLTAAWFARASRGS